MKKRMGWFIAAAIAAGFYTSAETVITSPTGLPDERDVALESAVKAVKETPADTVLALGGMVSFAGDEMRNTAHGVMSVLEGESSREELRKNLFDKVDGAWNVSDEIILCSYKITPVLVGEMIPGGYAAGDVVDVSSFFEGIDFPEGTGAYLWPDSNQLMVRNTRQNLLQVETALSQYHHAEKDYRQVEIKAKFIEVSQSTLNQLGFTWEITGDTHLAGSWQVAASENLFSAGLRSAADAFGGNLGAGSMVLTKAGWMPLSVTISALEQDSDSDVLSSPSLTTLNGKAAEIWVGEDRAVPKAFNVKSTDVNIHIEHKRWGSELMGVHFSVTPEIEKGDLIRLKLNPKIIDLVGYDTYQVSPAASMIAINGYGPSYQIVEGTYPIIKYAENGITEVWQQMSDTLSFVYGPNADPNDEATVSPTATGSAASPYYSYVDKFRKMDHETFGIPLNAVNGQLPYFRVREVKTQVVVADGSTVGLGGLIYDRLETYKDKVPVLGSIPLLGRLFRSEGERSIKRNLMIFVSAGQVANDGQRKADGVPNK